MRDHHRNMYLLTISLTTLVFPFVNAGYDIGYWCDDDDSCEGRLICDHMAKCACPAGLVYDGDDIDRCVEPGKAGRKDKDGGNRRGGGFTIIIQGSTLSETSVTEKVGFTRRTIATTTAATSTTTRANSATMKTVSTGKSSRYGLNTPNTATSGVNTRHKSSRHILIMILLIALLFYV